MKRHFKEFTKECEISGLSSREVTVLFNQWYSKTTIIKNGHEFKRFPTKINGVPKCRTNKHTIRKWLKKIDQ